MKIGALIGTIFVTVGAVLRLLLFIKVESVSLWTQFRSFASFDNPFPMIIIANSVYILGLLLVMSSGFVKSSVMLIISSIFVILAFLGELGLWFSGNYYNTPMLILNIFYSIAALLYFIGLITFRKHNIVAIITGLLVFLVVVAAHLLFGVIFIQDNYTDDTFIRVFFLIWGIEGIVWALHCLVFSFSKKEAGWSRKGVEDDFLSVESGAAFASYVPDEPKKTGKKKKKKKGDDEFTFDF